MKIGMIAQRMSRLNGGVSEVAKLACEALRSAGERDITLFTTDDPHLDEDVRALSGIAIRRSRSFGTDRYGFAPGMVRDLLAADLDILHVHGLWTFHACAAWIWQRRTGRPVVVTPHGMLERWILERSQTLKRIIGALYQRNLLERAAVVQVLTEKEAEDVRAVLPDRACQVLANYVARFDPLLAAQRPIWWREEYAGKDIYLFFGRLHEKKGIGELCAAWSRFGEEAPEAAARSVLVFCGWNDGIGQLDETVRAAGARHGNAVFAGPQYGAEKWRSFAAATFMVLPSKSEGLPMSILEAWSTGLPALMTEACNLDAGFETGAALCIGESAEAILAGLFQAAVMPIDQRARMADAARDLVASRFSAASFANRLLAIYQIALDRPSSAATSDRLRRAA